MAKYDDASWHWGAADFPDDAPEENGATHIGMFMTWTIERGLFADPDPTPREVEEVEAVLAGSMSGREFLLKNFNGKLYSDCFTEQAAAFADRHYDDFIADFQRLLCPGLTSNYYVEDSRENYEIMAAALDRLWARYVHGAVGTA
jgi:hypothetical protein